MDLQTSRRGLILGLAGASALTACSSAQAAKRAEQVGAFPSLPKHDNLLGPQPGVAQLRSNENPYGPADSALKMMEYAARKGAYYPSGAVRTLTQMIADRHGLDADMISVSTGSAEALSAIAIVYGQKGPIVAPRLFFDATPLYAQKLGLAEIKRAPMRADMGIDLPALEAMVTPQTGLVQICNPNNPTGMLTDPSVLKPAVKRMATKAPVVVDEAYMELTDAPETNTCIDLVKQGHDVIIARTFSKIYGMAGIRVGYVISSPETARTIREANMSWMSGIGLAAAIGCYDDTKFLNYSKAKIFEARDMIEDTLDTLGLERLPSQTNFVYFKTGRAANDIEAAFKAKNIRLRGQYMDYDAWTRVSTGHLADVERFCQTLPEVLRA